MPEGGSSALVRRFSDPEVRLIAVAVVAAIAGAVIGGLLVAATIDRRVRRSRHHQGGHGDDPLFGRAGRDHLDGGSGRNNNDGGRGRELCMNPNFGSLTHSCER